ncbi:UvrD-helicase domain-containing protein [Glaciecola sp. MH2013]|uniref:UvrD-helicase domain-containing protein n=1 Tax=Glaciecola sp. MH2013 TaxID=2785524 RepID=UPI00189DDCFE|nr:UvrD-helicase domain-containing protein [Glaciecola sp. MH2013]MBF7073033.1 UvrD-helicase domain-containing protein [Glaciecola sp. MH2013]
MEMLNNLTLPLHSRHLIEASAGTGKTFNITRLYVRLLLEKKLSVQQILVMTFTKAATEEIKARIAAFIREVEAEWTLDKPSEFTLEMKQRVDQEEGQALLLSALLSLDDASIFTIHGFCQRVLKQFAVGLNADMEPELLADTSDINLQATQDWIRRLSGNDAVLTALSQHNWHDPELFYSEFRNAIDSDEELTLMTELDCIQEIVCECLHFLESSSIDSIYDELILQKDMIFEALVNSHNDALVRSQEWQDLVTWLASLIAASKQASSLNTLLKISVEKSMEVYSGLIDTLTLPKSVSAFINGNRYRGKADIKAAFSSLKALKDELHKALPKWQKKLDRKREQQAVLSIVEQGIYEIRENVKRTKVAQKVMGFDDLIRQFSSVIGSNTHLVDAVRTQFPVALVDEFQDTDSHQYQILDALYPAKSQHSLLIMIGDPKQAIYGFRGGDIFVYLKAKKDAVYQWFMDTNWRSSSAMVNAYNRVFWGCDLSEKTALPVFGFDIHYEKIASTEHASAASMPLHDPINAEQVIRGAISYMIATDGNDISIDDDTVPVIQTNAEQVQIATGKASHRRKPKELEDDLLAWMTKEIKRLLAVSTIGANKTKPADIAILVRDGNQAKRVQDALLEEALASVYLSQKSPLFVSAEAVEVYRVLNAIVNVDKRDKLTAGLSSSLLLTAVAKQAMISYEQEQVSGGDALLEAMLNDIEHDYWDAAYHVCIAYQEQWQERGIFDLLLTLIKTNYVPKHKAERAITNMMHIAESLAGIAALNRSCDQQLAWLSHQIANASKDEALQLRLESDANLIKVVTLHGSKGLEYPIVFVPFASSYKDPTTSKQQQITHFRYQDIDNGKALYQLGSLQSALDAYKEQEHAESIRLLYVAITRAEHRCYLGYIDDKKSENSALNLVLGVPQEVHNTYHADDEAHSLLLAWFYSQLIEANSKTQSMMTIGTEWAASTERSRSSFQEQGDQGSSLLRSSPAPLDLQERKPWIISSFSNMLRFQSSSSKTSFDIAKPNELSMHAVESSLEHSATLTPLINANDSLFELSAQNEKLSSTDKFRFTMKKGADAGNLLHDILEHIDFTAANWNEAASAPLAKYLSLNDTDKSLLFDWLQECLEVPIVDNISLSSLAKTSTLREAEFYFPMEALNLRALTTILNEYRLSRCGSFDVSFNAVNMQNIPDLRGMMHGYIDLIFEHDQRYYVADYKSTHLGDSFAQYKAQACHLNNQHHLYDLQYLLYSLALHKYLQTNLVDYRFDKHFGGVKYLYLRGMKKIDDNTVTGVFSDQLEFKWIQALESAFSISSTKSDEDS